MNTAIGRQLFPARQTINHAVFSILIPSWNNLPYLQLCIKSIRQNSHYPHQLIVHVNEGKDTTLDWLQTQPDIDISYSTTNIGVCYALNACRQLVRTEYILYINDDMYVCPGWDRYLKEEIDQVGHNNFFISGTAIEPVTSSNCVIKGHFGTDITSFKEAELLQQYEKLPFNDWAGATWPPNVVHISVWDLVGGYSTEFSPGMYSDPDFSMKLWLMGIRLFKGVSKSRVYHFGSKSTKRISKNKGYYQFITKWGITSSTLTRFYLRRGEPYTGPLPEAILPGSVKTKNLLKRLSAALKRKQYE